MLLPFPIPTTSVVDLNSSNEDVRQFLADLLQHIDASIDNDKAWELARKFEGDGYDALELKKEGWQELYGESHGRLIFKRFFHFRITYVDASRITYVDKDTVWPHLRHIYRIFIALLLINTGRTVFDEDAFPIDGGWNIAAFVNFICYGFVYNFASAKSIDDKFFMAQISQNQTYGTNTEKLAINPWVWRLESRTTIKKAEFGALFTKT